MSLNKTEDIYARVKDNEWIYTKSGNAFIDGFERVYKLKVKRIDELYYGEFKGKPLKDYYIQDENDVLYKIYRVIDEPYMPMGSKHEKIKNLLIAFPPPEKLIR